MNESFNFLGPWELPTTAPAPAANSPKWWEILLGTAASVATGVLGSRQNTNVPVYSPQTVQTQNGGISITLIIAAVAIVYFLNRK